MLKEKPPFHYIRRPKILDLTGWSPSTQYREEKAGRFPKRYQISKNVVAWRSDEIDEWLNSRALAGGAK